MNKNCLKISIYRWAMLFFSLILFLPAQTQAITVSQEEALGRESLKLVKRQYQFIQDPCIVNYVNHVGNKIVTALPPQPFAYQFYVIQKDEFNAFAAPGGHIFIYSGLLAAMNSEEELAGILSHEIAHVVCRHISDNIDRSKKMQIVSLVGMAASVLLGICGVSTAAQAMSTGTIAGVQSAQLAYSREDEFQADQLGLTMLAKAGYGADGLLTMLKKIRAKDWLGSDTPTYLKTHPATEDRIAHISAWIEDNQAKQKKKNSANNSEFQKIRTKLIATCEDPDIALNKFKQTLADNPNDPMANYGYALVLERLMNIDDAITHLKIAAKDNPFDLYIIADLGRLYYRNGNYTDSIRMLENYIDRYPKDQEFRFYLASAQMEANRLDEAVANFEMLLKRQKSRIPNPEKQDKSKGRQKPPQNDETYRSKSESTKALYCLAQIFHQKGCEGDSHLYLGRYYSESGNLTAARFHLKKALDLVKAPKKKEEIKKYLADLMKKGKLASKMPPVSGKRGP